MSTGVTFLVNLMLGLVGKKVGFEVAAKAATVNASKHFPNLNIKFSCCQSGYCGTDGCTNGCRCQDSRDESATAE